MTLPNTHIIGVQKAATTSLHYWLSQHPDIYAPLAGKDYPFFADNQHWEEGLDTYAKLFSKRANEKITLAGSVHTLAFPHAQKRLYKTFKYSKLIIVLRDPVARLLSAYNYRVKAGAESLSFAEAMAQEDIRLKGDSFEDRSDGAYLTHGFYHKQLTNLLNLFPLEQIKIVFFEDIVREPQTVLKDIFEFLGVNSTYNPILKKKNTTGTVRNQWFFNLCFSDNKMRQWLVKKILGKIIPIEQRTKLRHWLKEINTSPSRPIFPIGFCKKELVNEYMEDMEALEKLTGRDLSTWKQV